MLTANNQFRQCGNMAKRSAAPTGKDHLSSHPPPDDESQDMEAPSDASSDSESEEEEDEEGEELTPALDAAILRTLARIRNKDEAVYGSGPVLQGGKTISREISNR